MILRLDSDLLNNSVVIPIENIGEGGEIYFEADLQVNVAFVLLRYRLEVAIVNLYVDVVHKPYEQQSIEVTNNI